MRGDMWMRGLLDCPGRERASGVCSSAATPTSPVAAFEEAPVLDPSLGRSHQGAAATTVGPRRSGLMGFRAQGSGVPLRRYGLAILSVLAALVGALAFASTPALAAAPETPETGKASTVTATTATLEGGVLNPHAKGEAGEYEYRFRVSETECEGERATPTEMALGNEKEFLLPVGLTELQPNAKYTFCLVERNQTGETTGLPEHFTTLPAPPTVVSESAPTPKTTDARLEAVVNPNNEPTEECKFEYGKTTSYGSELPCDPASLAGYGEQGVAANVTGLIADTAYDYRIVVKNATGKTEGAGHFTTAIHPETPEKLEAKPIGAFTATLHGVLNPKAPGNPGTYEFLYKRSATACEGEAASGGSALGDMQEEARSEVSGLLPHTTYTFCLRAHNEAGEESVLSSPPVTFTTLVGAPQVEEQSITDVAATSATFFATVNPEGATTTYTFEYAPAGGAFTPVAEPSGTGSLPEGTAGVPESVHVASGLVADTAYEFRLVASNSVETVDGKPVSFTTQTAGSELKLPDGRQWEQVSPPNTEGAYLWGINAFNGVIEASENGKAITYNADNPTELEAPSSNYRITQVLSTRTAGGWSTQDINTPNNYENGIILEGGYEYKFFSTNLAEAVTTPAGTFVPLVSPGGISEEVSPKATERGVYLRSNLTCQATPSTCYTPLVTPANTPPGTKIGGAEGEAPDLGSEVHFTGGNADLSAVVLDSPVPLVEGAPTVTQGEDSNPLYEWSAGKLQLVSVLPASKGETPEPVLRAEFGGVGGGFKEARNAISSDGSRIVWTDDQNSNLYMRDTVRGETVQIGGSRAQFVNGNSEDTKVFFVEGGEFGQGRTEHEDLYVFEVTSSASEPLAGKVTRLTENADVAGTLLGVSENGSYVYFASPAVLAAGAIASPSEGGCDNQYGIEGSCNFYVDHYNGETKAWEAPTFVTAVSGFDYKDWAAENLKDQTARVSPNGLYLAFMSNRSLTGYDNENVTGTPAERGRGEMRGDYLDEEVYLYHAEVSSSGKVEKGKVACASCNPTGARPDGIKNGELELVDDEPWQDYIWLSANVPGLTPYGNYRALYQSRYLSDSGRLFFNSHEALVPQDVNGTWDVYEYEPAGIGSCTASSVTFSGRSGGCVGLISSGESPEESAFLDASENGDDVFFLSSAKLAPTAVTNDYAVYDAHVCGAEGVACPTSVEYPPACTTESSCRPAPTPQPAAFGTPASATFNGAGNITPKTSTPPPVKPKTAAQLRAAMLAKALKACKKDKSRTKRAKCETQAHRRFGPAKAAKKASTDRRVSR